MNSGEQTQAGERTRRETAGTPPSAHRATMLGVVTLALALAHALLLVYVGSLSWHWAVPLGPEWLTALALLILTPLALRLLGRAHAGGSAPQRRVLRAWLTAVVGAYLLSPGFLLCWPLQALGFRLAYGPRLSAWAGALLSSDTSRLPRDGDRALLVYHDPRRVDVGVPGFVAALGNTVYVRGTTAQTRHVTIYSFGGGGASGFLVGGPAYRTDHAVRLWAGAYAFSLDSSDPMDPDW